jgi:RNA polymerase sigma-70 factor (ECF subfamily)
MNFVYLNVKMKIMSYQKINKDKINDIIKGCVNNDRKSQKLLFDLYAGKLMSTSYRYMGNKDEADEVLQEGFIKIFNKLATYNSSFDVGAWMGRIIVNLAIDKLRKRKKDRKTIVSGDDNLFKTQDHDEISDFDKHNNQQISAKLAMEAVSKLSPSYRMVFNLYAIENYTHAEIAEELGISEGTSKSNYFKAKANLRKLLKNKIEFVY